MTSCSLFALGHKQTIFGLIHAEDDDDDFNKYLNRPYLVPVDCVGFGRVLR